MRSLALANLATALLAASAVGCWHEIPTNTLRLTFPVTNQSNQVATLAIDGWVTGARMGRVTPAVLPPNSRTFVVIDVPPGTGWGLFVNAGRAGGGFAFTASDVDGCGGDVPIEVFIDRAGEPSWQAPLGQWCGPG